MQYEKVKYKSARDIIRQLRCKLWSWFEHWKNYTFKHKEKVRTNFKIMVITWMKRNLGQAIQRWKKACDGIAVEMQTRAHQETMLENEELQGQIEALLGEQNKRSERMQLRKLRKFNLSMKKLQHRLERNFFRRWKNNTDTKNDMFFASMKCCRKLYIRTMKTRFQQYKDGVKFQKVTAMLRARFDDLTRSFDSRLLDRTFEGWQSFIHQRKVMMRAMVRVSMAMQGQKVAAAFRKWVEVRNLQRHNDFQNTSMNLLDTSKMMMNNIGDMQDQFARSQQEAEAMYRKMIKQAERVMANFVVRCLNGTLGKGFYTWRDNVFEYKRQQNVMRRSLLSLLHSQYRPAFTKWRDYVKWHNKN